MVIHTHTHKHTHTHTIVCLHTLVEFPRGDRWQSLVYGAPAGRGVVCWQSAYVEGRQSHALLHAFANDQSTSTTVLFAYTAGIECPPAHEGKAVVLLTVVVRLLALEASSAVMRVGEAMIAARSAVAAQGFGVYTHGLPNMVYTRFGGATGGWAG